jgi:hypothetical protein
LLKWFALSSRLMFLKESNQGAISRVVASSFPADSLRIQTRLAIEYHIMLAVRSRIGQCCKSLSWLQHQQRLFTSGSISSASEATEAASISQQHHQQQPEASTSTWTPESQRTGVLAKKLGMSAVYDSAGIRTPVTVLQVRFHSCYSLAIMRIDFLLA